MTDDTKPDPIPDGEDEGSSPVPTEGPETITITEPTIIVPEDDASTPTTEDPA